MKIATLTAAVLTLSLAGCVNLPQTKALITPLGAIGVHSFAPPRKPPSGVEITDPNRVAQTRRDDNSKDPRGI